MKTPVLESLFNEAVGLRTCNCSKETQTQVFTCKYCENFKSTYFEELLQMAASVILIIKLKSIGHSILNQTTNMEWFLHRFVDLLRACFLRASSRNYFNKFLLINLQKAKTCVG